MKLSLPTGAQIAAFSRHIPSYVAGAVTVAVGMHFLDADKGSQITTAVTGIINGVDTIVGAVATLVAIASALFAAWTASPTSQIKAVAANPEVEKVVTTPTVAASVPDNKVVAK